tara:strand:+ start:2217 stop:3059 length:843 start_codon:yes stop_codon:yes gene_type:complete
MTTTTFDPTPDSPSPEQQAAETAALEQGEKIAQAEQEDRDRLYENREKENENIELIDGKFKSQEDLLKAYKELESKLGKNDTEENNETSEEQPEAKEETPEEPPNETVDYMSRLSKEFDEKGELSEEAIDNLSKMDSKDLIKNYLEYYGKTQANQQQATIQANEIKQIQDGIGGEQAYSELTSWAAENLNATEINDFNTVANSGNTAAIKFAVEALNNRYTASEGYEAPLVTGGKAAGTDVKPYRSQAELARDIANPLYNSDPAFRSDVVARLEVSTDLL